jgi:hypothetical protein
MLGAASSLRVVFCTSISTLRAFLSSPLIQHTPTTPSTNNLSAHPPTLAIVSILALHRNTSSWSAQGISQTLASAVDAAHRRKQRLLLYESRTQSPQSPTPPPVDDHHTQPDMDTDEQELDSRARRADVWDEEVSMLNVSTRTFAAGEQGWVGRTVRLRDVAGRWFSFA